MKFGLPSGSSCVFTCYSRALARWTFPLLIHETVQAELTLCGRHRFRFESFENAKNMLHWRHKERFPADVVMLPHISGAEHRIADFDRKRRIPGHPAVSRSIQRIAWVFPAFLKHSATMTFAFGHNDPSSRYGALTWIGDATISASVFCFSSKDTNHDLIVKRSEL